ADPALSEECKQDDKELADLASDMAKARLRLAILAMDLKLYSDAKVHFETLIQKRPADAELLTLLGLCEEESGRPKQAIEAYDGAILAEPTRVEAYVRLAGTYRAIKDDEKADAVIEKRLVERNPGSVRARLAAVEY